QLAGRAGERQVAEVTVGIACHAYPDLGGVVVDRPSPPVEGRSAPSNDDLGEADVQGLTTVLTGPGAIEQREYPVHDPAPGGLLSEMLRANVCGSDVHIVRGGHPLIGPGCALGHEGVGRVARLAPDVTTDSTGAALREGDR